MTQEHYFVEVRDNGIGIPEENLARIFSHGFTTKKEGHGFGLHNCANSAQKMGGSLQAFSDGAGSGATVYGSFPDRGAAEDARAQMNDSWQSWVACPITSGVRVD